VKMEKRSDESHLESLEGTNIDEENPIEIIERSCEKNPPEKLENAEGDKAELSKWKKDIIYAIFMVPLYTFLATVGLLCVWWLPA
ncbi:hypothetical protein MKW94_007157, partial [Papaver nudicaule]|nr:hypothetical protein [Papaver nudicaule]